MTTQLAYAVSLNLYFGLNALLGNLRATAAWRCEQRSVPNGARGLARRTI
jgi:hypothetical protein